MSQFWYTIDRDAKFLSIDYSIGMYNNNFNEFAKWVYQLNKKIMTFLNSNESELGLSVLPCNSKIPVQYLDFYRLSDRQHSNLHTIARLFFYPNAKNDTILKICCEQSVRLLKEKQPFRSILETCVIFESTIDEPCSIYFIKLTNNTKDEYQLTGPLDLLPSPKRYPSKGMLALTTWIIQMYTSSMGRIKIDIPLKISDKPKAFLGANQNAVYYKMNDLSVVKVFHNSKLCQNELKFFHLLGDTFTIFSSSSIAFQFKPLAKKIKHVTWTNVLQFLNALFHIHDKGIVHQNISVDSMMLTKSDNPSAIFVNFEYAVMIGDECSHQNCSKQIVSDRILQMRLNNHDPYYPHFNDDLQAFVRSLLITIEQIPLPSKTDSKTMLNFWKRVLSRRQFWSNLDVAASLGNRNIMIDLINGMKLVTVTE